MEEDLAEDALLTLTADIVAVHVANNQVTTAAVPELIAAVYGALNTLGAPVEGPAPVLKPAVPIRASVKPDYLICLEDGAHLKILKRYLRKNFDMSPEQYREKWGLPRDYPMVAPNYAAKRRELAHSIGLGRKPKQIVEEIAAPVVKAAKTARKTLGIFAAKAAAVAHLGAAPEVETKPVRKPRAKTKSST
jgi:predicted transcriptional regulator